MISSNYKIPEEITAFAKSAEIFDICEAIGKQYGLLLDQVGELDSEVRGVLLNINKPTDFTNHIVQRLEVNKDIAQQITKEVNENIFATLRTKLHGDIGVPPVSDETLPKPSHIADLEKAGGFTIEHPSAPITLQRTPISKPTTNEFKPGSNISSAAPTEERASPIAQSKASVMPREATTGQMAPLPNKIPSENIVHKEPLADQLLGILEKKVKPDETVRPEETVTTEESGTEESFVPPNLPTEETTADTDTVKIGTEEVGSDSSNEFTAPIPNNTNPAKQTENKTAPVETAKPKNVAPPSPPKSNWPDSYREPLE